MSLTIARAHGSFCRLQKISDCDENSARCPCDCGLPQGEELPLHDPVGLFIFNLGRESGPGWAMFFLFSSRSAVMLMLAFLLHLPLVLTYASTPDLRQMWRAGNEFVNVTVNGSSVICTMSRSSTNQFLGHSEAFGPMSVSFNKTSATWTLTGEHFSATAAENSRDSTLEHAEWRTRASDHLTIHTFRGLTRSYVSFHWMTAGNLGPESFHGIWLTFPSHFTVIFIAMYIAIFRASRKTLKKRLLIARHSPSHYTVHVTKLPEGTTEQEVEDFFNAVLDHGNEEVPENRVLKVLTLYRLGALSAFYEQRVKLKANLRVLEKARQKSRKIHEFEQMYGIRTNWFRRTYRRRKIREYHEVAASLLAVENEIESWVQNEMHNAACGVFVTFKLPQHAQEVLDLLSESELKDLNVEHTVIAKRINSVTDPPMLRVRKAPEPSDVNWANMGVQGRFIIVRSIITYTLFIVLCFATFEILTLLHIWRENGVDKQNYQETPLGRFIGIVQVVFIMMMASLVCIVGRCERMKRKSHDETSMMIKVSALLVLNVGVSILFIETTLWNDAGFYGAFRRIVHRLRDVEMPGVPWYLSNSVAHQILAYLMSSLFVTPLFILVDPCFTVKSRVWRLLAFVSKAYRASKSQEQLNKLWEPGQFFLYYRIAFILHITILALWYMAIAPLSLLLASGVLSVCYWADKYVLLRHRMRPSYQNLHVVIKAICFFQGALVLQPFFTLVLLIPTCASSVHEALLGLLIASAVALCVLYISVWSDDVGNYLLQYLGKPNECVSLSDDLRNNRPFLVRRRRCPLLVKAWQSVHELSLPLVCRYGVAGGQTIRRQKSFVDKGIPFLDAQYSFAEQYHKLNPVSACLPESVNPTFLSFNTCSTGFDDVGLLKRTTQTAEEAEDQSILIKPRRQLWGFPNRNSHFIEMSSFRGEIALHDIEKNSDSS
eukprot:GEMP01004778.1.p1 GENE.GEMP01004778.1~~GEMP01004778.1.p1  ORF type:complete len:942 (+),score=124.36 GEMP01004778.1:95-2920(+)